MFVLDIESPEYNWLSFSRTEAILIFNNEIYIDDNHSYCAEQITNFWQDREINLTDEIDYKESIEIINSLIHANEVTGYDLYHDNNNDKDYLVAHYLSNLNNDGDMIKEYAKKNNYILGAFDGNETLSNFWRIVKEI